MLSRDDELIFIKQIGILIDEYYRAPESIKPYILNEIQFIGDILHSADKKIIPYN